MNTEAEAKNVEAKLNGNFINLLKGNKNYMAKLTLNLDKRKTYYIRINCHFYGNWGIYEADESAKFKFQIRK